MGGAGPVALQFAHDVIPTVVYAFSQFYKCVFRARCDRKSEELDKHSEKLTGPRLDN